MVINICISTRITIAVFINKLIDTKLTTASFSVTWHSKSATRFF